MNIPLDVIKLIVSYLIKPKMKLLDWIPLDKLNWLSLSENPNAIHLLEQNICKINWYMLSGNPNAEEISKKAKIWASMMDHNGNVNSNYGYQWQRNDQLTKVINMLKTDPLTRRASISLYDGKELDLYENDTICTYAINFYIDRNKKLSMQVMMRSNDLVFGFCNDQYCFSELQHIVANALKLPVGKYHHYVCNLHIYERHYNLKK